MSNPFHDEINRLNKRLDQLTYLIEKQITSGVKGFSKLGLDDKARDLGKKLRTCCDDWISTSQETLECIKCEAEDKAKEVKHKVEENPLTSLAISALVGCLIGFIFSRRK